MNIREVIVRISTVVLFVHCASATEIRKNSEPYMYKSISVGRPITFRQEKPTFEELQKKTMMMMLGTAPEDLEININFENSSPTQAKSLQDPTPMEKAENTVEDMMKIMKMEDGENSNNDPLMQNLEEVAQAINKTQEVTTRTASASNNESAEAFVDRVKNILEASGIETFLPLDCGRNPLSPSAPLDNEPLPWAAALGSREDGLFHYRCTGMVITRYHIITDAECATSPNINIAQLNVTGIVPEPFAIEAYVVGRRIHPSIRGTGDFLEGDNIGILELANPLEFNDYVQPICLPGVFEKQDPEEIETTATIIGFDNINDTPQGRIAGIYTWPRSKTFGAAACYGAIKRFNKRNEDEVSMLFTIITKNHICIDRPFEDVGKSVFVKDDSTTGRVKLIGVGPVANARKTNPIAYSLIQPHRFWIELVLKKFRDNTGQRS